MYLEMRKLNRVGTDIDRASQDILCKNLVVFPTETVYGIGANALDEVAVEKIFKAKKRPKDNPLIVHVCDIDMVYKVAKNVTNIERKLMDRFWPGPLSIVLEKRDEIPSNVTAGLSTVSVRMPSNELALKLIKKANVPVAAPSANVSGKPSGTNVTDIYDELKDDVSYFLDGGKSDIGIESTVVRVVGDKIIILRPGKITVDNLKEVCQNVEVDKNCFIKVNKDDKVISPGMKHKHYAPETKCVMLSYSDYDNLNLKINNIIKENSDKRICFMCESNVITNVEEAKNVLKIDLGETLEDVSSDLFSSLRLLDRSNVDVCYIQEFSKEGIGLGVMNRVLRTCDYDII